MSNPVWPHSLGDQLFGIDVTPEDGLVRTQKDIGPAKVRRRSTRTVHRVSMPVEFTGAQYAIFKTFYETTLQGGALAFDWEDPFTDQTTTYRFASTAAPALSQFIPGSTTERWWRGTLDLEVLP